MKFLLHRSRPLVLLFLVLLGGLVSSRAQGDVEQRLPDTVHLERIRAALIGASFLDAACGVDEGELRIVYSRSLFRPGAAATRRLLEVVEPLLEDRYRSVRVTVDDRNLPFYSHLFPIVDGRLSTEASTWTIGKDKARGDALQRTSGRNSNFTVLFSLDPRLRFAFGAKPDPIQWQFNLEPSVQVQLWRGSQLQYQHILPIYNGLNIPEEDLPRPGLISFSQYLRLGRGMFANLTAGYFQSYRYGVQAQAGKFLFGGSGFLGATAGYTGYASFPKRLNVEKPVPGWQFSQVNALDYQLTAGWRWHRYDLQLLASIGEGLGAQRIMTFAAARQFRQTTVEFFVQQLDDKANFGLYVHIPIPFVRYFVGDRVTLQTGPFLNYRYNGTQNYPNQYSTGQVFPFLSHNLHPNLIFGT